EQVEVVVRAQTTRPCVLHWGVRRSLAGAWETLPAEAWPEGTVAYGRDAMRTNFVRQDGESRVAIRIRPAAAYPFLDFALFFPEDGRWDNNGGRNYQVALTGVAEAGPSLLEAVHQRIGKVEVLFERVFEVEQQGRLAAALTRTDTGYQAWLMTDAPAPLVLHWGIARRSPHEWLLAPESVWPPGTTLWEGHTAQTPLTPGAGRSEVRFEFPEAEVPLGIQFVLRQGAAGRWLKDRGGNFYLPVHVTRKQAPPVDATRLAGLGNAIVRAETGGGSWTLMHRYNLCHDLLERAGGDVQALALLYVWLRFSAIRQLTWQRNYNTKPRELSHAQDRLTQRLAEQYREHPAGRPILRLMLATVGRGGEGQRIRDEILAIMHRHHLKEVSGHFMEEWHQKLHNNTTPDDLVICEAYLEFLRSHGNRERFYEWLQAGGVTRQRLEHFERPIRTPPDFVPHLKDGLIHDFENFFKTLKAVHAGTDFETAANCARDVLDGGAQQLLGSVWEHRNDPPEALVPLVAQITELRHRLSNLLSRTPRLRDLLYLDLALEQRLRVLVERHLQPHRGGDELVDLIAWVLENAALSFEDPELGACMRHWERLRCLPRFGADWSLHAKSVTDRIGRALSDWIDRFYQLLQPKAEFLGQGFGADTWAVVLFSEEVVRGSSLGFILSLLLHQLEPRLRQAARLGAWQVISRGRGAGTVEVVEALRSLQGRSLARPTVVVAQQVAGDEEIPEGVAAVIAPDVTDLVSHVAVRARNANLLFASCHDPDLLQQLRSLRGQYLELHVTAAGDVVFEKAAPAATPTKPVAPRKRPATTRPRFTRYALGVEAFSTQTVGAKSRLQAGLRGRLPDWIRQPPAVAVPFGVFEKVLAIAENDPHARRYAALTRQVESDGAKACTALREAVQALVAPESLRVELQQAMKAAAIDWPGDWNEVWRCLKQVWASKWNERAWLSRRKMGVADADLFMAVLLQPVVEAEYAFVVHTVNPATGNPEELYAELVCGLGETLVGNYPGRALGFVWNKATGRRHLTAFPGKSLGQFGGGLVFRSDSNGEDLPGYAGAGLYDSVFLPAPRSVLLDYSEEPLVWDEAFRDPMLGTIARLGVTVEGLLGAPQDLEGVCAKGEYYLVQTRPQVGLDHA
ncbi:MAG: hypothetical protein KGS61_10340, partial [Verrucomicrobia bacterium]|nr:hypothetical protein [Verrucomicrobiota bacterium]